MGHQDDATAASYRERIQRVLDHIEATLGRVERADHPASAELDMNALAQIACFSPYHFHRVYRGLVGETAAQTVRRLRLHRASVALVQSARPVAEIARGAGYGSLEAFSRAFASVYGAPPSAYRAQASAPEPVTLSLAPQETDMTATEIQELPTMRLAATPHRGPYYEIGAAFQRLSLWASGAGLFRPDTLMVGVYYDDPQEKPEAELRSDAGMTLSDDVDFDALNGADAAPAHVVTLAGGPHAVRRHVGPYAELPGAWDDLYRGWLPQSGREPANAPPFEIYRNSPLDTPPAELITDICVPLTPQS